MKRILASLRARDFFALICALLLAQLSKLYSHDSESIEGSIELSFYSEYTSHISRNHNGEDLEYDVARPVPFDVDGDGIIEAVVVPSYSRVLVGEHVYDTNTQEEWSLKVLDLRPLHSSHPSFHKNNHASTSHHTMLPIRPDIIFTSNKKRSVPVKISTGQIILFDNEDKKYSCGKTGEKCHSNGTRAGDKGEEENYVKNRWHGIPSIATLWSDGNVTLHGITATKDTGFELGMVELWNVNPFQTSRSWIEFREAVLLLENNAPIGRYGALVLAAKYYKSNEDDEVVSTIYVSFDLLTGDILWTNEYRNEGDGSGDPTTLTVEHPNDHLFKDATHMPSVDAKEEFQDCHSLINNVTRGILTHAFSHRMNKRGSMERDTQLLSTPTRPGDNPQEQNEEFTGAQPKQKREYWMMKRLTQSRSKVRYKTHPSKTKLISDALVFHNRQGVDVLSAKDGKILCQQPLLENVFYADLDSDGIMEHLHFVSHSKFQKSTMSSCASVISSNAVEKQHNTTLHLCKDENVHSIFHPLGGVSATLPLIVENGVERGEITQDIVYALNIGIVKRFDIHGHCKWTARLPNYDFPSWDAASPQLGYLSPIDSSRSMDTSSSTSASTKPFILAGDDKIALFTIGRGRLLDQISLPQTSVWKPILSDLNGDGTTDVLIVTTDGIWGYCIQITAIGSAFLWIMNAFLFLFLSIAFLLALLDGSSQDFPRSTDCVPDLH